jgi:hypothetical protein
LTKLLPAPQVAQEWNMPSDIYENVLNRVNGPAGHCRQDGDKIAHGRVKPWSSSQAQQKRAMSNTTDTQTHTL